MDDLIDKLRGIEISVVRANRALLGTTPVTSANELVRAASDRLEAQEALLREAADVLGWYDEQSRLARLIHSEGDAGRHAIAADGGGRASATLAKLREHLEGSHAE